jgi:class 3 adenylate cyclase
MQRRGGGPGLGAVLFTDIVGSTAIAAEMGNTRWSELVARHHRIVRRELDRFGGREMDTAGDGFFATFGRPADAIRCAVSAADAVRELGIEIRAGVSFGEMESVGKKASGLVVNTAARVMSVAGPGEVLVPASVREIVQGGPISFTERGTHQLKGLEGEFRLFTVTEVDGAEPTSPLDPEEAAERRREIFPAGTSRRRALSLGIAAGVLVLILAGVLLATSGEKEPPAATGELHDTVAPFDVEQQRVGARIPIDVGTDPMNLDFVDQPIAAGEGAVWALRGAFLVQIDPQHPDGSTVSDVGLGDSQTVATGFDSAWALSGRTVFKAHPGTGEATPFFEQPEPPGIQTWSLALGDAIWMAESDGTLVRIDPHTGATEREEETGLAIELLATTRDRLWASMTLENLVVELDPSTLRAKGSPIPIGGGIQALSGRGEGLWVLDGLGVVTRVNAETRASRTARVGEDATGIAVGRDAVWVGDLGGSLYRIDPTTLVLHEFEIGYAVLGVAVDPADDSVWRYLGAPVEST